MFFERCEAVEDAIERAGAVDDEEDDDDGNTAKKPKGTEKGKK